MTPTEKQKCVAEQAVYGLKLEYINATITAKGYDTADNVCGVLFWNDKGEKEIVFERDCTPILRPLSDLTKEITHKGYNDDKPFVPLVALESHFDKSMYEDDLDNGIEPYLALEYATYTGHHFAISDLLHLWHFDTRSLIKKCEAIDVNTLSINPYSVQ